MAIVTIVVQPLSFSRILSLETLVALSFKHCTHQYLYICIVTVTNSFSGKDPVV